MRDVPVELLSPLMNGQTTPWVDRDVRCNAFLPRAHCTSLLSATQAAS